LPLTKEDWDSSGSYAHAKWLSCPLPVSWPIHIFSLIVCVLFFHRFLSSRWPISDRKPFLYLYLYLYTEENIGLLKQPLKLRPYGAIEIQSKRTFFVVGWVGTRKLRLLLLRENSHLMLFCGHLYIDSTISAPTSRIKQDASCASSCGKTGIYIASQMQ